MWTDACLGKFNKQIETNNKKISSLMDDGKNWTGLWASEPLTAFFFSLVLFSRFSLSSLSDNRFGVFTIHQFINRKPHVDRRHRHSQKGKKAGQGVLHSDYVSRRHKLRLLSFSNNNNVNDK